MKAGLVVAAQLVAGTGILAVSDKLVLADDAPLPAEPGYDACPVCGCKANHCDTGRAAHLQCPKATDEQKAAVERRRKALDAAWAAEVASGESTSYKAINVALTSLGYYALKDPTKLQFVNGQLTSKIAIDIIGDYIDTGKGPIDGWVEVTPQECVNYASVGWFVLGIIKANNMVEVGAKGSMFVVKGGKYTPEFKELIIINASSSDKAQVTTGDHAVQGSNRQRVRFFALKQTYKNGVISI